MNRITSSLLYCFAFLICALCVNPVQATQPQIPTLQVCNNTKAYGKGIVSIPRRADLSHSGTFVVRFEIGCDPSYGTPYPSGNIGFYRIDMSDSSVYGDVLSTTIDQVTTTGKHTPTMFISGRCKVNQIIDPTPQPLPSDPPVSKFDGCRYWAMIVDNNSPNDVNRASHDIVSFLVFNGFGTRIAYGTGPLVEGDIVIAPTSD